MSRSYKKHPWITDHHVKSSSERKKFANKKVRHTEDLPSGGAFKKVFCSYDICDFKFFQTKEEALDYANNLSSLLIEWYGIYELSPKVDYLISIEHKRLIPHDDKIIVKPKDDGVQQKLHKQRQKKK